jgi:hypothetical protein
MKAMVLIEAVMMLRLCSIQKILRSLHSHHHTKPAERTNDGGIMAAEASFHVSHTSIHPITNRHKNIRNRIGYTNPITGCIHSFSEQTSMHNHHYLRFVVSDRWMSHTVVTYNAMSCHIRMSHNEVVCPILMSLSEVVCHLQKSLHTLSVFLSVTPTVRRTYDNL